MNFRKYLRIAIALFQQHPIGFSLSAVLILLNLLTGNGLVALFIAALTVAEARILLLKDKVRLLTIVAGGALTTLAFGGLFNE
jgi:hypothetical protein